MKTILALALRRQAPIQKSPMAPRLQGVTAGVVLAVAQGVLPIASLMPDVAVTGRGSTACVVTEVRCGPARAPRPVLVPPLTRRHVAAHERARDSRMSASIRKSGV